MKPLVKFDLLPPPPSNVSSDQLTWYKISQEAVTELPMQPRFATTGSVVGGKPPTRQESSVNRKRKTRSISRISSNNNIKTIKTQWNMDDVRGRTSKEYVSVPVPDLYLKARTTISMRVANVNRPTRKLVNEQKRYEKQQKSFPTTTPIRIKTTTKTDFILITDYDQLNERSFWQKYGHILSIAIGISLGVACISVLFAVTRCPCHCGTTIALVHKTIRRDHQRNRRFKRRPHQYDQEANSGTSNFRHNRSRNNHQYQLDVEEEEQPEYICNHRRLKYYQENEEQQHKHCTTLGLTLPIALLPPEDTTLLHNIVPEHPVPMLSVQTAGYAGMERLGVPTRTTLTSPPDDRGQFSYRMRVDALQARELLAVRGETVIRSNSSTSRNNNTIICNNNSSINNTSTNYHQHQHQQQHQQQQHHKQHSHQQHQKYYQRMTTPHDSTSTCGETSGGGHNCSITTLTTTTPVVSPTAKTTQKYAESSDNPSSSSSSSSSNLSGTMASSCDGRSIDSHSHDHHQHYQHQLQQQQTLRCPHHVPLPDSEWCGQETPTNNRQTPTRMAYQQSEITRTCIKPPPNKTIKDVPEQSSYNFYTYSTSSLSGTGGCSSSSSGSAFGLGPIYGGSLSANYVPQHHYHSINCNPSGSCSSQPLQRHQQPPQSKSKPNVITKLFSRKSSPKSPTALASSSLASCSSTTSIPSSLSSSSSSSSSSSASLSASSVASTMSLNQVSAYDHRVNCPLLYSSVSGSSPVVLPSKSLPMAGERIPTPPLSVTVPIVYHHQHNKQFHQQQHQQLLDSIMAETATPTTSLQTLKSNSCSMTAMTVVTTPTTSSSSSMSHKRHKSTVIPSRRTSSPSSSSSSSSPTPINMRRNTSESSITAASNYCATLLPTPSSSSSSSSSNS